MNLLLSRLNFRFHRRATRRWGCLALVLLIAALTGCGSKTGNQVEALGRQQAYLAGQNSALQQQLAQQASPFPTITVLGHVQNSIVPWVAGLTLTQAIATANYLDSQDPHAITVTRQGNTMTVDVASLLQGPPITLEPGDTVEIR